MTFQPWAERDRESEAGGKAQGEVASSGILLRFAKAMMDADSSDSDGDGMSNLLERAFGGDSLGPDDKRITPRALPSTDDKQRITFVKYDDDSNEEGIEYIVEVSTDLRTWKEYDPNDETASGPGIKQVDINGVTDGKGAEIGGGMERVVYETVNKVADGQQQFLRLRIKTK